MPNDPLPSAAAVKYSFEEEVSRWKNEYQEIKHLIHEEMASSGADDSGKPPAPVNPFNERRSEPRYPFMAGSNIFAHMGPRAFPILNISIGGLAFHSDILFEQGQKLLMSALGMIALEVEVLSCDMEETDANLMEFRYRVRARFSPHVNGYQVYVLAREMHLQNTKAGMPGGEQPQPPKD